MKQYIKRRIKKHIMKQYIEHHTERVGRLNLVSYRCIQSFPISWLERLFKAIKVSGEHRLYLSDSGLSIMLDTTNSVGVVQMLEASY